MKVQFHMNMSLFRNTSFKFPEVHKVELPFKKIPSRSDQHYAGSGECLRIGDGRHFLVQFHDSTLRTAFRALISLKTLLFISYMNDQITFKVIKIITNLRPHTLLYTKSTYLLMTVTYTMLALKSMPSVANSARPP